jgi:ribosomal protein S18 acetylase RimI-like enzyme
VKLAPLEDGRYGAFWRLFTGSLPPGVGLDEGVPRTIGELRQVEVDGDVAGYLWLELRGRELHVHALLLEPAFRGRGVGGEALRAAIDEHRDRADAVELGVEPGNARARALYDRLGFAVTGEREGFLIMRLTL